MLSSSSVFSSPLVAFSLMMLLSVASLALSSNATRMTTHIAFEPTYVYHQTHLTHFFLSSKITLSFITTPARNKHQSPTSSLLCYTSLVILAVIHQSLPLPNGQVVVR